MRGQKSVETPIPVPASQVWDAYRGLELGRLVDQLLGDVIGKVEVVDGDGGVGTIVKLTYPPGTPGIGYLKEMFTKIDDDKRVKETEVIEGGFKELGLDACRLRLEIVEKDAESTIIRSTIKYEVDDSKAELASLVSTNQLELIAETVGKYLSDKKPSTESH